MTSKLLPQIIVATNSLNNICSITLVDSTAQARSAARAKAGAFTLALLDGNDRVRARFHVPPATSCHANSTHLQIALLLEWKTATYGEVVQEWQRTLQVRLLDDAFGRCRHHGNY